jgi:hypothetical protein
MRLNRAFAVALLVGTASFVRAGEVVVLKGGTVVPLKEHWVRRGNTAYMTRSDGTLFSVPVSEIDREKTAAANRAAAAPAPAAAAPAPSTPAEIARAPRDTPKAKVRITDADVSHPLDMEAAAATEEKKETAGPGGPKVEVADWTQEKNGESLQVRGTLRNTGQATAESVRVQISAIDEKGQAIDGTGATLSKGSIDPGGSIEFNGTMKVPADRNVASIRFAPQWTAPRPPVAAAAARPGTPAAATGAPAAARPVPTPYGRGNIYAAPVANAPSQPPADGKTGYIPGATSPDNQPKPPSR